MSDEATEAAENSPQSPSIQINAQYTKDLSFESPRAPMVLQEQAQPAIEVSVDVKAHRLAEKSFEVVLSASADAKTDSGQVFLVELTYAGAVSYTHLTLPTTTIV